MVPEKTEATRNLEAVLKDDFLFEFDTDRERRRTPVRSI